jgi:hypothetical protein
MKNKLVYNKYFFITATFIFCCINFFIFYCQATSTTGYPSDLPAHIGFITNPGGCGDPSAGYSLLHQLIRLGALILAFLKINIGGINSILIILTLVVSQLFTLILIRFFLKERYKEVNPYFIDFFSISVMLISMVIINPFSPPLYLGTGTPNVWHNPTYIFCKPFCLLVFIFLLKSYDYFIEKKEYTKMLFLLSLFSVLSMWAKPSFLMSFLPSVAIIFIYKYFKKEISIRFLVLLAISLLPSIIPFIYTNYKVFHYPNSTESVIIAVGRVWNAQSKNIPLSILLAMAFPLYVFILKVKKLSTPHLLVFINYLTAMLIYFLFAEKGFRMYHGNFSWGYKYAMFFMFLVSIEEFFFKNRPAPLLYKIGWVLFLLHLLSGLYYLIIVALGHNYF